MGRESMRPERAIPVNLSTIENIKDFEFTYHDTEDTLFIQPTQPRPAVSMDWHGEMWLRIDLESGDIVGMEIGDFEAFFIKKHPEIAPIWKDAKPLLRRGRVPANRQSRWDDFMQVIVNFLSQILKDSSLQGELGLSLA